MEVREASAAYRVAPAYMHTPAGSIPVDWSVIEVAKACLKIQDGTHFSPKLGGSDYLYITSRNIRPGKLDLSNVDRIDGTQHREIYRRCDVRKGDLLLTKDGANTGNAALNNLSEEFSLLSSVAFLRFASDKYNAAYFLQKILAPDLQKQIQEAMSGNAITRLTLEKIRKLIFAVPPTLNEQNAIASALSDADALIEALEELLAKKRQIKQGSMQELLTGHRRLPGFAGEWDVKSMADLFEFSGGFTASRDQLGLDGYCYLHYGDIHTSTKTTIDLRTNYQDIPKLSVELKRVGNSSLLRHGDVVFVDASEDDEGTSKHIVVENPDGHPFISGLHTLVARSKTDELVNLYKRYCFQTSEVKAQFRFFAVGTKVSGISKTNIAKINILVPPREEQTAIATVLSDMDADIAALEAKLAKARDLKQGMMQELLTGRIRLV